MIITTYDTEDQDCPSIHIRFRNQDGKVMRRLWINTIHTSLFQPTVIWHISPNCLTKGVMVGMLVLLKQTHCPRRNTLEGRKLIQVIAPDLKALKQMRDLCDETWEADIGYADRYLIDEDRDPKISSTGFRTWFVPVVLT